MCPPNFEASAPFIRGCLAKYGQTWRTIGPKAGKQSHTAGLLYISGRYDVYVACGFLLQIWELSYRVHGGWDTWAKGWQGTLRSPHSQWHRRNRPVMWINSFDLIG